MEIKVGIQNVNREVSVETEQGADEVVAALETALRDGTALTLTDKSGRRVIIPAGGIAYLDLGQEHSRKVGFALS